MSMTMEEGFKRWTAKRKAALVTEIIQGKTSVAEASRAFDILPSDIEEWVDDGRKGLENASRTNPMDVKERYERQIKELQEAYGEAMLELRAIKQLQSHMGSIYPTLTPSGSDGLCVANPSVGGFRNWTVSGTSGHRDKCIALKKGGDDVRPSSDLLGLMGWGVFFDGRNRVTPQGGIGKRKRLPLRPTWSVRSNSISLIGSRGPRAIFHRTVSQSDRHSVKALVRGRNRKLQFLD